MSQMGSFSEVTLGQGLRPSNPISRNLFSVSVAYHSLDGAQRERMQQSARDLSNVRFLPFYPANKIPSVLAAAAGVAHVGFDPNGAGLYVLVIVDAHARVFYCHLSSVSVAERQAVSAGEVVGAVGESGRATGPHLHFEVQLDGSSVDPVAWLGS